MKYIVGFLLGVFMGASNSFASPPQCDAYVCLNNLPGQMPAVCSTYRAPYFAIRIFTPQYNPSATAKAREAWLRGGCPTMMPALVSKITKRYGKVFADPGI